MCDVGMVDLHSHLLPGLDDGARDLEEALAIARSMVDDGIKTVVATPHVRDDYPTAPEQMESALATVRAAIAREGIPLEVLGGGEIALDRLPHLDAGARARFGLGGNPRLLLLEFPYSGWPLTLPRTVWELASAGFVSLIAHPERNTDVQEQPERLEEVVRVGGIVQLTAASVDGRLGKQPAKCAKRLLELGLAHVIASDAHAPSVRGAGMSAAIATLGDAALGSWLTSQAPRALLAGEPMPPSPLAARHRGLRGRLRG